MVQINKDKITEEIAEYLDINEFKKQINMLKENFVFAMDSIKRKSILESAEHLQDAIADLTTIIHHLVLIIEKMQDDIEGLKAEKKAILVEFLDEQIDLPFYLEWIDDRIISDLVDEAVDYYNNFGWEPKNEIKKRK